MEQNGGGAVEEMEQVGEVEGMCIECVAHFCCH